MKRYNLASGDNYLEGWVNVDYVDHDIFGKKRPVDILMDIGIMPWDIEDETAGEIQASHILEHFTKDNALKFIRECYRILRFKGVLHIAVPDMDKFIDCRLSGDWSPLNGYKWTDLNYLLGGDSSELNDYLRHKYMYNYETLHYMLENYGFRAQRRTKAADIDTLKYEAISLYVDAVKL